MRHASRLLALALVIALAAVCTALAAASPATGGSTRVGVPEPVLIASPPSSAGVLAAAGLPATPDPPVAQIVRAAGDDVIAVRARPGGPVLHSLAATTEFGSPRALGVVRRRGRWLGITTETLPNGRLGWVDSRGPAVSVRRTRWSLHADASSRRIVVRRDGRVVRRLSVAVGRPESPTPTGRFAVTDKLAGSRFGPYYGCCILAISATQPNKPPGWTGGNRMAIHGTDSPSSIGTAASAGCLRAADPDLAFLMRHVPLGTPVVIER